MYKMSNPPANLGKKWSDEEIQKLLQAVKRKETIQQIATAHERTPGGIRCRLKDLAADYYFNDNRPIQEIMKFTGLDIETVTDAISRRQYQMDMKDKKQKEQPTQPTISQAFESTPKKESMTDILIEIRDTMKEMLEIMKKNDASPS